jgi:uncharacterized membrane protein YhhN
MNVVDNNWGLNVLWYVVLVMLSVMWIYSVLDSMRNSVTYSVAVMTVMVVMMVMMSPMAHFSSTFKLQNYNFDNHRTSL